MILNLDKITMLDQKIYYSNINPSLLLITNKKIS